MAKSNRGWRKIIPGLIISVVSLILVLYLVDLRRMVDALRLASARKAAKMAGKYRGDLYALMKKHDLDPAIFKKD